MTITDAIISQFVNNPGKEFHILDLDNTGNWSRQARGIRRTAGLPYSTKRYARKLG